MVSEPPIPKLTIRTNIDGSESKHAISLLEDHETNVNLKPSQLLGSIMTKSAEIEKCSPKLVKSYKNCVIDNVLSSKTPAEEKADAKLNSIPKLILKVGEKVGDHEILACTSKTPYGETKISNDKTEFELDNVLDVSIQNQSTKSIPSQMFPASSKLIFKINKASSLSSCEAGKEYVDRAGNFSSEKQNHETMNKEREDSACSVNMHFSPSCQVDLTHDPGETTSLGIDCSTKKLDLETSSNKNKKFVFDSNIEISSDRSEKNSFEANKSETKTSLSPLCITIDDDTLSNELPLCKTPIDMTSKSQDFFRNRTSDKKINEAECISENVIPLKRARGRPKKNICTTTPTPTSYNINEKKSKDCSTSLITPFSEVSSKQSISNKMMNQPGAKKRGRGRGRGRGRPPSESHQFKLDNLPKQDQSLSFLMCSIDKKKSTKGRGRRNVAGSRNIRKKKQEQVSHIFT